MQFKQLELSKLDLIVDIFDMTDVDAWINRRCPRVSALGVLYTGTGAA